MAAPTPEEIIAWAKGYLPHFEEEEMVSVVGALVEVAERLIKDRDRMDYLDRSWVHVLAFPHFNWMSDRTEVHPNCQRQLSNQTLRTAIDEELERLRAINEAPSEATEAG